MKHEYKIEKGKPYTRQPGRKVGEGRGKIHPAESRFNQSIVGEMARRGVEFK